MSKVAPGAVVLMPIFAEVPVPDWNNTEFPMFEAEVHRGTKFVVPDPVTVPAGGALVVEFVVPAVDEEVGSDIDELGVASTKAEGGNPPMVSASAAFRA